MKKSILACVGSVVASLLSPAFAADLPVKGGPIPPYIAPYYNWSGFYIGVNGGYMWGSSQWTGGAGNFEVAPNGFMIGGTLGYNFQAGSWVLGIEGDIDYTDANGTANTAVCAGCTFKDTWLATVRGRVGIALDRWLPYVTAGGAWGNVYVSSPGGSVSSTKGGWTAGVGVEYAFAGPWTAKIEYLYVDLGTATCGMAACLLPADASVSFTANIVRVGLNYRF